MISINKHLLSSRKATSKKNIYPGSRDGSGDADHRSYRKTSFVDVLKGHTEADLGGHESID